MTDFSNKKKLKTTLILVILLVVPGFFYFLLRREAENRYKLLPIFGNKRVASTFHSVRGKQIPDTIYHKVSFSSLALSDGEKLTDTVWKGKIILLNFFNPTADSTVYNPSIKPMKILYDKYSHNALIRYASLSVVGSDIQNMPNPFLNYQNNKWDFFYAPSSVIQHYVKEVLLSDLVVEYKLNVINYIFSNKILVIDSQRRIRGFYDATEQDALSQLDDELRVLVVEELRNMKDGR